MRRILDLLTRARKQASGSSAAPLSKDNRRIPCAPRGQQRPLFFVHIPKTSGSSINALLARAYGEENFVEHLEYALPAIMSGKEPAKAADGISGHILLSVWKAYRGTEVYGLATVLRDPWARLVSHVNWVARMMHGEELPQGKSRHSVAAVARQIARTDFNDRASLEEFVRLCDGLETFNAFHNLQTRMVLDQGGLNTVFRRLTQADGARAVANLDLFDVLGICEDQARFAADLAGFLGHAVASADEVHENRASVKVLDRSNDLAREVMGHWIALDQTLYDAARRKLGL